MRVSAAVAHLALTSFEQASAQRAVYDCVIVFPELVRKI